MITQETAEYFLEEINNIYNSKEIDCRKKLLQLRGVYRKLFTMLTENEPQYFSSVFARTVFAVDKYNVPAQLADRIRKFRWYANRHARNKSLKCSDKDVNFGYSTLFEAIGFFSGGKIKSNLDDVIFKDIVEPSIKINSKVENVPLIRAVVIEKGPLGIDVQYNTEEAELICDAEEYGKITVLLKEPWLDVYKNSWKGAVLNIFDVKRVPGKISTFRSATNTLLVLEPDNLVDVTDIAECFQYNGSNALIYFLSKLKLKFSNPKAVMGNIVNSCFDEILNNPEANFEDAYENALRTKPLQIYAIASDEPAATRLIKEGVRNHFDNLMKILSGLDYDRYSIEPTFISSDYGLQGRLDLLIEFDNENNRKNIIELKSGKAPGKDMKIALPGGGFAKSGIWENHYIQAICYNLLLDSTFEHRTGTSQILYSQTEDEPLRNAPNIIHKKQEAIALRNNIVAYERHLAEGDFSLFDKFNKEDFGYVPKFDEEELAKFEKFYNNSDKLLITYFQNFISFILKESRSMKHGTNSSRSNKGFSSLWKDTIEDKENSFDVLSYLQLLKEESDFDNFHLVFKRTLRTPDVTSFRKGDIGILYRIKNGSITEPLKQQILKCSIKEIGNEKNKVSLRNKQANSDLLDSDELWVIEPDYIDSSTRNLFQSVYRLMLADEIKRKIILGLRKPEFNEIENNDNEYLNEPQKRILANALSAKNYFLIQGPPGTGKTAYMLKAITEALYRKDRSNLLLLAYTNRAVDEICTALDDLLTENIYDSTDTAFDYLRLGSKESTENDSRLIAHLAETMEIRELFSLVKRTRVFVSTVTSAITNPELFQIKKFNIAIIDEASQILEPQIAGILTMVDKFIMIGDEKQLPAVVVQPKNTTDASSEELEKIHLINLAGSLFERLIRCCIINGWNEAYGMLTHQARMHEDIQDFVNNRFYDGNLQIMYPRQKEPWRRFDKNSGNIIERQLSSSRVLFFESKPENNSKVHKAEAKKAAEIVKIIYEIYGKSFNERTVGVIAPFRAQCAEIYKNLPKDIADLVTVDTVERFQGSQREIIIISFAINNLYELKNMQSMLEIGDIKIDRKLNVALTRAKEQLILLGVAGVLYYSPIFKDLLEFVKGKGGYYDLSIIS